MTGIEAALAFAAIVLFLLALSTATALYRLSRLEEKRLEERMQERFGRDTRKAGRY